MREVATRPVQGPTRRAGLLARPAALVLRHNTHSYHHARSLCTRSARRRAMEPPLGCERAGCARPLRGRRWACLALFFRLVRAPPGDRSRKADERSRRRPRGALVRTPSLPLFFRSPGLAGRRWGPRYRRGKSRAAFRRACHAPSQLEGTSPAPRAQVQCRDGFRTTRTESSRSDSSRRALKMIGGGWRRSEQRSGCWLGDSTGSDRAMRTSFRPDSRASFVLAPSLRAPCARKKPRTEQRRAGGCERGARARTTCADG